MDKIKLFDRYEILARQKPALIIIFPSVISVLICFPSLRTLYTIWASIFVTYGIIILMAKAVRDVGKRKEEKLYANWGGMPTTVALRFSDNTIDKITKKRYHDYLQKSIKGINMPNEQEELQDPLAADIIYVSAIKWLLEKTRDHEKYNLVFEENINYGFSRNLWASKPFGLILTIITATLYFVDIYCSYHKNILNIPPEIWVGLAISILAVIAWLFFITPNWVHNQAKAYVRALLSSCEDNGIEKS